MSGWDSSVVCVSGGLLCVAEVGSPVEEVRTSSRASWTAVDGAAWAMPKRAAASKVRMVKSILNRKDGQSLACDCEIDQSEFVLVCRVGSLCTGQIKWSSVNGRRKLVVMLVNLESADGGFCRQ